MRGRGISKSTCSTVGNIEPKYALGKFHHTCIKSYASCVCGVYGRSRGTALTQWLFLFVCVCGAMCVHPENASYPHVCNCALSSSLTCIDWLRYRTSCMQLTDVVQCRIWLSAFFYFSTRSIEDTGGLQVETPDLDMPLSSAVGGRMVLQGLPGSADINAQKSSDRGAHCARTAATGVCAQHVAAGAVAVVLRDGAGHGVQCRAGGNHVRVVLDGILVCACCVGTGYSKGNVRPEPTMQVTKMFPF